jgi:hypothetical protein
MQIVIDIPEEEYNIIKNSNAPMSWVEHLIANGIPLPKGHGKLGDLGALSDYFWDNRSKLYTHKDLQIILDNAEAIIPADTESEE